MRRPSVPDLPKPLRRTTAGLALSAAAYALLTALLAPFFGERQILDVALVYLLLTLVVAALWGYWAGLAGAVIADLLVNFFFVPPVHTFTVQHPANVGALLVFLAVAFVGASMLALLRRQVRIAEARAAETAILLELSRDVALAVSPREALNEVCRAAVRAFHAQGCAIVRPGDRWTVVGSAGGASELTREAEAVAMAAVRSSSIARFGGPHAHRGAAAAGPAATITFVPFGPAAHEQGVLRLVGALTPPPLVDLDRLLQAFADEASVAVSRAALAEEAARADSLQRADEFKTLLLSSVSHDLRTPLTAIRAAADSLLDATVDWSSDDRTSFLTTIATQADRLNGTVDNLLELSRLEGGAVRPTIEAVDVDGLLNEARMAAAGSTGGRTVTVDCTPGAWVSTDYGLLVQALVNLVQNAARYSKAGGAIRLAGARSGRRVILTVHDEGPPIPPTDLPHLFERFYRGSQAGNTKGSGLGLAIVKAAVQLCGGTVRVEAAEDGNSFLLDLPAASPPRP